MSRNVKWTWDEEEFFLQSLFITLFKAENHSYFGKV